MRVAVLSGLWVAAFLVVAVVYGAPAAPKPRALVLLDDFQMRNTHTRFFRHLTDIYELDFQEASDEELALSQHGVYLYEALIHMAPSATEFGLITVDDVLNFIDDGHSVLLVGSTEISDTVREIATECGIEIEDEGSVVVDHFGFDKSDDGSHTLLVAENVNTELSIVTGKVSAPSLFRGIGHTLEKNNKLLLPVLRASATAYSSSSDSEANGAPKGNRLSLVSALQARNNARISFVGSLDFFSDKFYSASVEKYSVDGTSKSLKSGNEELGNNLVSWTFGQRGVLRSGNVQHRSFGRFTDEGYTIKDDIEYTVDIEERRGSKWVPYVAQDVQLEYVMLSPYVRTFLNNTAGTPQYKANFRLPDVYGIFTFRMNYNRPGYTSLSEIDRVTIRPVRHDQYERFIISAYPYYASSFSMMLGLFIFGLFFLYSS